MPSTAALFGEDSSSESESEKPKSKGKSTEEKATKSAKHDDDSDQDEEDFDDRGAVVGLSSSTMTGRGTSTARTLTRRDDDEEDDEDGSDADIMPVKKKQGDTRTLVIQEYKTRPNLEDTKLRITKLPKLLGIQTQAFDESTYAPKVEEADFETAAFNLMRWRYGKNGELESNTRFVEWEDGSITLHIGKEAFTTESVDASDKEKSFPGMNGYLYISSEGAEYKKNPNAENADTQQEESANHVLECLGAVHSRLVIKPSSIKSAAHKSLTLGIRQKTLKTAKIAEIVTHHDPEKLKSETVKLSMDMEKVRNRNASGGGHRSRRANRQKRYLEDDYVDDEGYSTVNLKSMKQRTMGGDYDDDEESEDDYGSFRQAKKQKTGGPVDSDSDEMVLDTQDDDDAPVVTKRKQQQKASILADDDDSD